LSTVIEIFKEISQIPRCSGQFHPFIEYIKDFAYKYEYDCCIDQTNNILIKKENCNAKICLQAHYDMVCLEDNCVPELIEEDGFFMAKNSTLGADNGIGCAYMLSLIREGYDCEFLFTSDEEIGLIGANNLQLDIQSGYMLNLDSETEGEICIGCAGGVDIFASINEHRLIEKEEYSLYELSIGKLPGGHSGVDIHKNIENALKLLSTSIKECNGLLLDINGGERINSIPVNAKAIIASKEQPTLSHTDMKMERIDNEGEHLNVYPKAIIDFMYAFENGVREHNDEVNVVETSINLAKVHTQVNEVTLELSARSMDNDKLKRLVNQTVDHLEALGFKVHTSGKYPAWKPDINEFTSKVLDIYQKYDKEASLQAIHAGLECAIFKDKFPSLKIASIGPNIYSPHSKKERVEIESVHTVYTIVKEIIETVYGN
jgi:dipeptidase D